MIIIGFHSIVNYKFSTEPQRGSILYSKYSIDNHRYYRELVDSGVDVLVYLGNIGVKYIVTDKNSAKIFQKIVENYLFDSKLLVLADSESDIEWVALNEIDGIIEKRYLENYINIY